MKPGGSKTGLIEAFSDAFSGIVTTSHERNFRIELCFAVAAFVLGIAFGNTFEQWLVVAVCIGLVLGGECVNSAVEAVVDLVSPDEHPLAKRAKDAAAGGVLLFSIAAFVVGVALYLPPILRLIGLIG
ncbi:MAG: diacylglycerol kinase family protein [Eggerthellaceae bacterium]|nr:diacylglycerol kinase family protein [Eggerthellaceae bacterium]